MGGAAGTNANLDETQALVVGGEKHLVDDASLLASPPPTPPSYPAKEMRPRWGGDISKPHTGTSSSASITRLLVSSDVA